jgi:predicted amidohydrolase YtcJ
VGLTGVNDFDGVRCFKALQRLQAEGKLLLRVTKSIPFEFLPQAATIGLHSGFGDVTLRRGNVKCFSDGALGPQTAAMLSPYEGKNAGSGVLMMTSDEILDAGKQAASSGLALAIHAIGDLANRTVLNGFEMLRAYEHSNHLPHLRHRIEHVQLLHPYDYRRLADLDLIASVQPIHATSDMRMADRYWSGRSAGAYAYHTLLKHQTPLAFGSDAPVELPNPFLGLHAAVTRRRTDGYPPEGWYPEQRLSLAEALEGFTTGAAYAGYQEHALGCLAPGYQADLIVLDEDPFTIPPQMIWKVIPSSVMIAGQWVWQKEA